MFERQKTFPTLAAVLVGLAGAVSLAQVLTFHVHGHRIGGIDDSLLPFTPLQNSHLLILGVGILLLYLSLQIYRRKRLAYQLVSVGLALLIGAELLDWRNIPQLLFYAVTLGVLLSTDRQFTVKNDNLSLRRGLAVSAAIIMVVFLYAAIGFSQLDKHEVGVAVTWPQAAKYAVREVFTFQESQLPYESRHARWFAASVNTASSIAYILLAVSLFRPLQFKYGASPRDRRRARAILEAYSTSTDDYFKLWPQDKHYFFSDTGDSFVAYKVSGRDALALEGPAGNPHSFPAVLRDFAEFSHLSGWSPVFVSAPENLGEYIVPSDYQRMFIGNEAVIDVEKFASQTYRSKHFRYVRNRAERDGLAFEYWKAPLTSAQLTKLRHVSDAWLSQGSRREYTFALGYFDPLYLKACDVAVLIKNGRTVAYANLVQGFSGKARTIDHMRYTSAMPPAGMHYLLMQLIFKLHEAGVAEFNLGLAPLSGMGSRESTTAPERLLAALKRLGSAYYSFGGLEQFKNKFEPSWQPRYIYYQGTPARLISLARSLTRALSLPEAGRGRRLTLIGMSVVAALCYSSFPLAYLFNPHRVIHGLASDLASAGAAYAGVFNGLDVLSSVLLIAITGLIWSKLRPGARLPHLALTCFTIGAAGALLAAVTPLPAHEAAIQENLHDVFTAINFAGLGAAALCLVAYNRFRYLMASLWVVFIGSLFASVVWNGSLTGSVAQRIAIVFASLWMVVITAYLSRPEKLRLAREYETANASK